MLNLKKSVYGICQSSHNFFHCLSNHLGAQGMTPSKPDPCLFVGALLIIIVYVDGLLIYVKSDSYIYIE
jgi:hypothetical protein